MLCYWVPARNGYHFKCYKCPTLARVFKSKEGTYTVWMRESGLRKAEGFASLEDAKRFVEVEFRLEGTLVPRWERHRKAG